MRLSEAETSISPGSGVSRRSVDRRMADPILEGHEDDVGIPLAFEEDRGEFK